MDFPKIGYPTTVTVLGKEVLIYNIYGGGDYPVHGAYFSGGEAWEWIPAAWTLDGKKHKGVRSDLDLARSFIEDEIPEC